jgi:hypothetical protein
MLLVASVDKDDSVLRADRSSSGELVLMAAAFVGLVATAVDREATLSPG